MSATFDWQHIATHEMGSRSLFIYRDETHGATKLEAVNHHGFANRRGKTYFYADTDWVPVGPFGTEDALREALQERAARAGQLKMEV